MCETHYCDNQGLCHQCGIMMEPSLWEAYTGKPYSPVDHPAIEILRRSCANGMRYMDSIYGPRAKELRCQIASAIHGRKIAKSDKLCQYGNLRESLCQLVGANGDCIAAREHDFTRILNGE